MPTAQIVTIIHKTGLNIDESEVLVLPVHSRETRLVSFETRRVSRDGGNLLLSGTVKAITDHKREASIESYSNTTIESYKTLFCRSVGTVGVNAIDDIN